MNELELEAVPLAVCRLAPDDVLPAWVRSGSFSSVTRTVGELSIVCDEAIVPDGIECKGGWRALRVPGPLDFSLTGIFSSIASPLAVAGVSIFAISTFETDYVLVPGAQLEQACKALRGAGFTIDGV